MATSKRKATKKAVTKKATKKKVAKTRTVIRKPQKASKAPKAGTNVIRKPQ
jgi:hypothetical protein